MSSKKNKEPNHGGASKSSLPNLTISIYQQSDHVAGLVQQLFGPLATAQTTEFSSSQSQASTEAGGMDATLSAQLKAPLIGKVSGSLGGNAGVTGETHAGHLSRTTTEHAYSQAVYLLHVRNALLHQGLLKTVTNAETARTLQVGDFVEFEAKFTADQVAAVLDIFSPVLAAEITKYVQLRTWVAAINDPDTDDREAAMRKAQTLVPAAMELAKAVTHAVRSDFRSDKTREYYGAVGNETSSATAIVICDTDHFVVDDQDRILDGHFRVLGKVTEPVVSNRPILALHN